METTTTAWSWKQEPELMARLGAVQNHPANINQDIMTFAGMVSSRAELERHVLHYEGRAAAWMPPQPRRKKSAAKGISAAAFMANFSSNGGTR